MEAQGEDSLPYRLGWDSLDSVSGSSWLDVPLIRAFARDVAALCAPHDQPSPLKLCTANVTSWRRETLTWCVDCGGVLAVQELHLNEPALKLLRIDAHKLGFHLFLPDPGDLPQPTKGGGSPDGACPSPRTKGRGLY